MDEDEISRLVEEGLPEGFLEGEMTEEKIARLKPVLDKRGPKIARAVRSISDRVLVLALGSDQVFNVLLKPYFEKEFGGGLTVEPLTQKTANDVYRETTPKNRDLKVDGRHVILFDDTLDTGKSMVSAIRWALQNREALGLQESGLSTMVIADYRGGTNLSIYPKYRPNPGPLSFIESEWRQLHKEMRQEIGQYVNGEVYNFGRSPNWRLNFEGLKSYAKAREETGGLGFGYIFEEVLEFVDGFPSIFLFPRNYGKRSPFLGFGKDSCFLLDLLANKDLFYLDLGDGEGSDSDRILFVLEAVKRYSRRDPNLDEFLGGYNLQLIKRYNRHVHEELTIDDNLNWIKAMCQELDTDRRVLVVDRLENCAQIAKHLRNRGYGNCPNFRFVSSAFRDYPHILNDLLSINDAFHGAFIFNLLAQPSDLGDDVDKYCKATSEELRKTGRESPEWIVATKPARVYGIGLCLGLGLKPDKYIETDDLPYIQTHPKIPRGSTHFVHLDRAREILRNYGNRE